MFFVPSEAVLLRQEEKDLGLGKSKGETFLVPLEAIKTHELELAMVEHFYRDIVSLYLAWSR